MHNKTTIQPFIKLRRVVYSLAALGFVYALSFLIYPTLLPDTTQATAGVDSTPTLEISPTDTVALNVTPGVFNSASQTVSVRTTNYTGYTLSLAADTSADLVGDSATIPTISLPDGTASLSSSDITNGYGYSLDATNYKPVLTGDGSTLDSTNIANTTANDYTLTFGANAEGNTPAGTYTKAFTVSAKANDTGYVISYNANAGSDTVGNMPSPNPNQGTISGLSVYLSSTIPTRNNYTFLGWDEDSSATTPTYEAGDSFALDPEIANQKTLYAIWQANASVITYDANVSANNPAYFGNNTSQTSNEVQYKSTTKYVDSIISKTDNIGDEGNATGTYATDLSTKDVVTIPGAV